MKSLIALLSILFLGLGAQAQQRSNYLSNDERRILDNGEIEGWRYGIGGVLSIYPGFGIGHAVQGRYSNKGWIYTVGELGSLAIAAGGVGNCIGSAFAGNGDGSGCGLALLGILGFYGFKIWEIIDAFATPLEENRTYRRLKKEGYDGFITPTKDGAMAGLTFKF